MTLLTKSKLSAVLLLGIGLTGLQAQKTILASGGNASGSGGSVSYSVGQLVYTTIAGTNGSVAQGVQQPYISVVYGLEEAKGITMQCSAYPNPATGYVKLKVENYKTENLTYQLYDVNGKLLKNKKVEGNETTISMENLVPATYFLKVYAVGRNDRTGVTDNNKEVHHVKSGNVGAEPFNVVKIFKIIKN